MASPPGGSSLFDTEADSPSSKKKLTEAAAKKVGRWKWAFIDALTAAPPPLTDLDVRVGIRLVKYYNHLVGYAYPSQERLAEECHCNVRSIKRCIKRLVEDGWFRVKRSGKGRENTKRYRPEWKKVTLESPFHEPKENTSESEREMVTPESGMVTLGSVNGDSRVREMVTPESPYTLKENLKEKDSASLASPPEGGSRSSSLEGEKQGVRQGNGELVEDGAPIGENVASGTIPPGKPSLPFQDTFDPSTSSLAEPLSSPFPANRDGAGVGPDVEDHSQRRLSLMSVLDGGREKADTEDLGFDDPKLRPLKAAKKSAELAIGKLKFLERDQVLTHRLVAATVPADVRDGVRRFQYLKWADELVETSAASGGAA